MNDVRAMLFPMMVFVAVAALSAGTWPNGPGDGEPVRQDALQLADIQFGAFLGDCNDSCVLCPDSDDHSCILDAGAGGAL